MRLNRGSLLHERYRILEILGQGGMGSVYRALDINLGMEVAVKENLFTTEDYIRQFRREANILATLRHPNLPRVTDHFVRPREGQYLIMDYIEGEDLRNRMERQGKLNEDDVILLGAAICDALTYLHTREPPILHRDIKPGNIKITPDGEIYLVDFGLAKLVEGNQTTTAGAQAMTPGFSSPEQYGTGRTEPRSDIYSLGATIYAALTGAIPEDALERAMAQVKLTPLRKHSPMVSRRIAKIVEKALEVDPEDRYNTADEFKAALLKLSAPARRLFAVGEVLLPPPPLEEELVQSADVPEEAHILAPLAVRDDLDDLTYTRKKSRSFRMPQWAMWIIYGAIGLAIIISAVYFAYKAAVSGDSTPEALRSPTVDTASIQTELAIAESATEVARQTAAVESTLAAEATLLAAENTPMGGGYGQVAFASNRTGIPQVWVINADGTGLRQITFIAEGACQPDWSPDGRRLVFISPCEKKQEFYPNAHLFIIDQDGTNMYALPTPEGSYHPAWSPDGAHVAYTSYVSQIQTRIYKINVNDNAITSLIENETVNMMPTWSADGQTLMYISTLGGSYRVWVLPDGGEPAPFSRSGPKRNTHPTWSPNGLYVVFTQSEPSGGIPALFNAIFDMGEDAEYNEAQVAVDNLPEFNPDFSSDGQWLVFESWPDGVNHDIFIMLATGVDRRRLTNDPSFDFDAAWRP